MKLYILSPSETVNPPSRSHSVVGDFCFLLLMSLDIFSCLDIREDIVLQILELRLLLGFLQIAIRQHIIAETAVHRRIIDEATLMISPQSGYLPNRIPSGAAASADPRRSPRTHNSDSSSRKA